MGSSGSGSPILLGADADLGFGHLKDFLIPASGAWAGAREGPGVVGTRCFCAVSVRSLQQDGFGAARLLKSAWGSYGVCPEPAEAVMRHPFWHILGSSHTKLQRLARFHGGTSASQCR